MKPARPFHINFPWRRADGSIAKGEEYFEVVGHRDGPVVARFHFDPKHPEYEKQALSLAEQLCKESRDPVYVRSRKYIEAAIDNLEKLKIEIDP